MVGMVEFEHQEYDAIPELLRLLSDRDVFSLPRARFHRTRGRAPGKIIDSCWVLGEIAHPQ